jgi:hypothetical protein
MVLTAENNASTAARRIADRAAFNGKSTPIKLAKRNPIWYNIRLYQIPFSRPEGAGILGFCKRKGAVACT